MKEGESVLGGPQANPGSTAPSNTFGPQLVGPGSGLPQMSTGNLASQPPAPIYGASQFSTFSNNSMATPQPNTPTLQSNTTVPQSSIPASQPNVTASLPFSQPQQPVMQPSSRDVGDVIISNAKPKKHKKSLIVGIILIILALIVAGIVMVFLSKNDELYNTRNSFNEYANYILFGDKVDTVININIDNIEETIYALDCEGKTPTECRDFFSEAKMLLDNFKDFYYRANLSEKANLSIENYLSTFDAYYTYINFDTINEDTAIAKYISDGYDGFIAYVKEYYDYLLNNENLFLANYGAYEIERVEIMIDTIRELDQAGCIIEGQYSQDCAETFESSEDIRGHVFSFLTGISNTMSNTIEGIRNNLVYGAFSISNMLLKDGENNE